MSVAYELPFEPYRFIEDPHKQTIISSMVNFLFDPPSDQKLVKLADGDIISLEITTPRGWKPTDRTIFMVHGLCGSHQSPYMIRIAKQFADMGIRVVRYNMRGCGSGKGLSKHIYHSGRSDDIFECLKVLKKETPESPTTLIGFSLGGNVVLKLVGELGSLGSQFLDQVYAISPPVELYASILMMGAPENGLYERYFYKLLRADVHYRHNKFKDLPRVYLPRDLKMYEFDQVYTAPVCGFANAIDYYHKCSSAHVVSDIDIPCRILLSEDDPIISHHSLDAYHLPSHVELYKTKRGGHMGYLGRYKDKKGLYWLDNLLADWVSENG
ncbi:MAG: alpha/beta fold hydrolase [Parachlamydiales bacterium]|nr:alpha/beta fold hydrolase [Parachlamydiales bacterium]